MDGIEKAIVANAKFEDLPQNLRRLLQNSREEWNKQVKEHSLSRQLKWSGNCISRVMDERVYYVDLLNHSRKQLMVYPYHCVPASKVFRKLRTTPFKYYLEMILELTRSEKSYDTLPNFTAADCVRVIGIGRNQYIEIMNKCRIRTGWTFKRKRMVTRDMLPTGPIDVRIAPWWRVYLTQIYEEDIKTVSRIEHEYIDLMMSGQLAKGKHGGPMRAGELEKGAVHSLYRSGLIFLDIPVAASDHIVIPPLEGFVMNRVTADWLERLLYQIFVSIDENTTLKQLAQVLEVDVSSVQQSVSIYCRLGFAKIKEIESNTHAVWHPSWQESDPDVVSPLPFPVPIADPISPKPQSLELFPESVPIEERRAAFVYDSTLTAFLMMGNLSPGLKTHAVTLFEVGKLPFESLAAFIEELGKVTSLGDEHTQSYSDHALTLRDTLLKLQKCGLRLDMLRSESITTLELSTRVRVVSHNYSLLIFLAPLSPETHPGVAFSSHLFGPAIPEMNSVWFKLFLYFTCGCGPPSILFAKGTRVTTIPKIFQSCEKLLVTQWDSESITIHTTSLLSHLSELLINSPVIVQCFYGVDEPEVIDIGFPFSSQDDPEGSVESAQFLSHPAVVRLREEWQLDESFGFLRMARARKREWDGADRASGSASVSEWVPLELHFGIPLFDSNINRGIFREIESRKLFSEENMQKHKTDQRNLCLSLLEFIEHCLTDSVDLANELGDADNGSRIFPSTSLCWDGERFVPFS